MILSEIATESIEIQNGNEMIEFYQII